MFVRESPAPVVAEFEEDLRWPAAALAIRDRATGPPLRLCSHVAAPIVAAAVAPRVPRAPRPGDRAARAELVVRLVITRGC